VSRRTRGYSLLELLTVIAILEIRVLRYDRLKRKWGV